MRKKYKFLTGKASLINFNFNSISFYDNVSFHINNFGFFVVKSKYQRMPKRGHSGAERSEAS